MPQNLNLNLYFDGINAAAVCALILHCLRADESEASGIQAAAFWAGHNGASMNISSIGSCLVTSRCQWVTMNSRNSQPHSLHTNRVMRTAQLSPKRSLFSIPRVLSSWNPQSGQFIPRTPPQLGCRASKSRFQPRTAQRLQIRSRSFGI